MISPWGIDHGSEVSKGFADEARGKYRAHKKRYASLSDRDKKRVVGQSVGAGVAGGVLLPLVGAVPIGAAVGYSRTKHYAGVSKVARGAAGGVGAGGYAAGRKKR